MDVVIRRCAGLDIHKKSIAVCVRIVSDSGRVSKTLRTYRTTTRDLSTLATWLVNEGVTHVAMESTGVYWKPIFNIFEDMPFETMLCNAQHVKIVPGRKTDLKDCEWIAQLLQHGLLKASFVPPREIRELRDLTRHRTKLADQKTAVVNRIHKTLEDANIKLSSVASDIVGVSGRAMIEAIIKGEEDPKRLADLAKAQLRGKIPDLELALEGRIQDHHRFMLARLHKQLQYLEDEIDVFDMRVHRVMAEADAKQAALKPAEASPLIESVQGEDTSKPVQGEDTSKPVQGEDTSKSVQAEDTSKPVQGEDTSKAGPLFESVQGDDTSKSVQGDDTSKSVQGDDTSKAEPSPLPFLLGIALLVTIPGVQRRTAENLLAEIGTDMRQFPTAKHLASWAGVCPGNNESAGKRRSGATTKGNRWVRRLLTTSAWSLSRSKATYFSSAYKRLAPRRGKNKALVAIGHSLLVTAYHMLRDATEYSDLGPDHYNKLDPERQTRYYVRRLEALGHKVTIEGVA
jgi:transposase